MCDSSKFDIDDNYDWDDKLDLTNYNENDVSVISGKGDEKDNRGLERNHIQVLKKTFGHSTFRTLQWKIIRSVMIEKKDVCAIMATGYGKSLCYQFPSVYTGGVTIVISPLISLMEDQVLSLKMANIPACLLGSAQTQKSKVLTEIMSNEYRIVYATPEFCTGDNGLPFLQDVNTTLNVDLLAIDEAHCVSQWGHDFRVKYRHLSKVRNVLKNVPVLAVTATATKDVRTDIIKSLKLRNPNVYCSGFDRPNLFFEVILRTSTDPMANLRPFMINEARGLTFAGPTIIYCLTKKQTEEVARNLMLNKIDCLMYHASLSLSERKKSHEKFARDQVKVIVATIAFGMGIDKPDVRMVIHYGASKDLEGYYQEVGRAGRDGLPSRCVLLHNSSDFHTHENIREFSTFNSGTAQQKERKENMSKLMQKYIDTLECRRKFILDYFQDDTSNCNTLKKDCCDNCKMKVFSGGSDYYTKFDGLDQNGQYNLAEEAKLMLEIIRSMGGRYGMMLYVYTLRGSKNSKVNNICQQNKLYGAGKQYTEEWWKYVGSILEREGLLKKERQKTGTFSYSTIGISPKGQTLLSNLMGDKTKEYRVMPTKEMMNILKTRKKTFTVSSQSIEVQSSSRRRSETSFGKNEFKEVVKSKEITTKPVLKLKVEEEDPTHKEYRMTLYNKLMTLRSDIAHDKECMPYMICSNTALMSISKLRPRTIEDLKTQSHDGFTDAKIEKFGLQIVNFIKEYCLKNPPPDNSTCETVEDIKKPNFSMCTLEESDEKVFKFKPNKNLQNETIQSSQSPVLNSTCDRLDAFNDLLMDDLNLSMEDFDEWNPETENKSDSQNSDNTKNNKEILREPVAKKMKISETKPVKQTKKKSKTEWNWD